MAFAIIAHVAANAAAGGTPGTTTSAGINTTGADLLIAFGYQTGGGAVTPTISDSKTNIWTPVDSGTNGTCAYVAAPTAGTGHTFSTSGGNFPNNGLVVIALSGSAASPLDQHVRNTFGFTTSVNTGSVTPTQDNEFIFDYVGLPGTTSTATINSSQTIEDNTNTAVLTADAYEIQTTATTRNPLWSGLANVGNGVTGIATFKAAAAAAGIAAYQLIVSRQAVVRGAVW